MIGVVGFCRHDILTAAIVHPHVMYTMKESVQMYEGKCTRTTPYFDIGLK